VVFAGRTTVERERTLPTTIPIAPSEVEGLDGSCFALAHDLLLAAPPIEQAGRLSAPRPVELHRTAWTFALGDR
jgi:hypothetical protein